MLVPAGGKYINGITVDSMYGSVDIGLRGAVHTWDFDYDYEYYVIRYKDDWEPYLEKRSDTVETSVTRRAYYLYIWNLDLYDFAEATVTNGSMTNGSVTYQSSDEHLMDQEIEIGNTGPVTTEELDQYLITNYGRVAKGT
ncbi:MAG: hypothetical protein LUE86_12940, partial [Clostridiales bacterium]|nr:hypothetical protein [Clostridiales bacterium]